MHILTNAGPLVSLIAGILILVVPRLLNYIVAIYLIVIGGSPRSGDVTAMSSGTAGAAWRTVIQRTPSDGEHPCLSRPSSSTGN